MTAEEYLKNEFPHLNNDIVSEKFNKDVFISCMEQYAKQEKIKLIEKMVRIVKKGKTGGHWRNSTCDEFIKELKTLKK